MSSVVNVNTVFESKQIFCEKLEAELKKLGDLSYWTEEVTSNSGEGKV